MVIFTYTSWHYSSGSEQDRFRCGYSSVNGSSCPVLCKMSGNSKHFPFTKLCMFNDISTLEYLHCDKLEPSHQNTV
jgi:hypothetical protein